MDFNYRKVATVGKRKRVELEDLEVPPTKRVKLETPTEWFHNYEALSTNENTNSKKPQLLSLPRQPLSIVNSNTANQNSVKLQPKSLELLERSKTVKKPLSIITEESKNTKKTVVRRKKQQTAATKKTKTATTKKRTTKTQKPERTKQQELFPFEGLEIFPRIFVGGVNVAKDRELIDQRNIKAIVNATKELPNYFSEDESFSYYKISVTDSIDSPLSKYFDEAADFMNEKLEASDANCILVHCQMGQSRSPSVIIACKYLYFISKHSNVKFFKMQ